MWDIALLVSKLTTMLVSVSPCDLCIVFAAVGRNGNCFLTTCAVLFLPTANVIVTGIIGVHVASVPCTYRFLFYWRVFSPTWGWSNCTHMIPDDLSLWCSFILLMTLPAPFVMPSSVRTFIAISVLSPASWRLEIICFVFLGSCGICFMILSLSSAELAPTTLSFMVLLWYTCHHMPHGGLYYWSH